MVLPTGKASAQLGLFPSLRQLRADVLVEGSQCPNAFVMSPLDLSHLCMQCTGLQELALTAQIWTLTPYDSLETVAAIQSMTSLQHLTSLKFTPRNDLALLALVRACCVLEGHSLQQLHVSEGCFTPRQRPGIIAAAWMQLGQMRRLRKLAVRIPLTPTHSDLAGQAAVFMTGCSVLAVALSNKACHKQRSDLSRLL
jgi:hypothetical protein